MYKLYNGDCIEIMKNLEDKSINLILCDLPYGISNNEWDNIIPYDKLWEQYNRLLSNSGRT